jgi:uncharacterized membrane protein YedE/YeeE
MAFLVLAVLLALVIGFAAHRASVCTVRAVAEIASSRRAAMLGSVGKSVLWVWAVSFPFFWLVPAAGSGINGWSLTLAALGGGFAFGFGAAINGGCAYSTMTRFVDGDGRMLAAILGFAAGVLGFVALVGSGVVARPQPAPAKIDALLPWAAILAAAILAWALYEAIRLWRSRDRARRLADLVLASRYRLSTAALLMGVPGAILFLIFGAFGYTATFELVIEAAIGTRAMPPTVRWILLVAVLAGMLLSTIQRGSFRLDWRPRRAWLFNITGGVLMGFGTGLAPGGNDAIVLYGIPTLSPYALPAFVALLAGVAAGLALLRLCFGIHARVECRNDTFVHDSWSRPLPPEKS